MKSFVTLVFISLHATSGNNREIEILSNTSELQAVKSKKHEMCQFAFYRAGELKVSDNLNVKMEDGRINEISVADPSRKLNRILLTVSGIYNASGDNFQTFTDSSNQQTLILVDLPQGVYAGRSVNISFQKTTI